MKFVLIYAIAAFSCFAIARASDQTPHKQMVGSYRIYGGELGDPLPPSAADKKITFSIQGSAAREMFDAIGPDVKDVCTDQTGIRSRQRDHENLSCQRSAKGEYSCNFGFDLRSGKSIGGIVC
ncbi:hypothetical protein Q4S45_22000 [Massilia sp. R2A-15]|uniref:hypothetical protein n=1 Tax=Massilia sp. R2A-15 TaxID=3064278 RepID=UPI002735436A|nr:hypothetical protein [Massilia sp. R2A-15]WLI89332.1 hypothetical protein Q4S45_22000 [Massilia sp. R2A-15]